VDGYFVVRGNIEFVKRHKAEQKQGIGLYSYEQVKNTTPLQYFCQLTVGTVIALLGAVLGVAQYQSASRSLGYCLTAVLMIVIGTFMGHAGAIFWFRRLRKR
jgi:hypothetical protein